MSLLVSVVSAMCSAINASSSLSVIKPVAPSPDIQHKLIISFAFFDRIILKLCMPFCVYAVKNFILVFYYNFVCIM